MTYDQYAANLSHLDRKGLLKLCRAGGITAHAIKDNAELIRLLFNTFGK